MKGLLFLLLAASGPASGQDWPPPLPALPFSRPSTRPPEGEELGAQVLSPGLALLEKYDVRGLGGEAGAVSKWSSGRTGVRLIERGGAWALMDSSGAARAATPALGAALRRMNAYFAMTPQTLARPITHAELAAAFTAPDAVAAARDVFDRSIAERVRSGGQVLLPELGGEATLDGSLRLHFNADPQRPALGRLIARRDDPAALARLFNEEPESMARLDPLGILKRHLATRARWDAEGKLPQEKKDAILRMAVDTVVESAAAHYSGDFGTQLAAMTRDDWSGRYAGTWHCHPGDVGPAGWTDNYPPSDADYEAAAKTGQELVITFLKDGFDVYDLSLANGGREEPKPVSYRSPEWRAHFDAALARLQSEAR